MSGYYDFRKRTAISTRQLRVTALAMAAASSDEPPSAPSHTRFAIPVTGQWLVPRLLPTAASSAALSCV